jgi:signal transduction histidine kinase
MGPAQSDRHWSRRRATAGAASVTLLALVGVGDWLTGPDLSFALFYLIPLFVAALRIGRNAGLLLAVISAVVSFIADRSGAALYSHPLFLFWNSALRFAFFVTAVVLVSEWKRWEERLAQLVEQRTAELRSEIQRREQSTAAMKLLAAQLSQAEQAERSRIAHDIHDSLSQMLTLLKLNLQSIAAAKSGLELHDSVQMVEELIKQAQVLTFELHPAMLDDLGLPATLQWYAVQFGGRTRAVVTVSEHGNRASLPRSLANYLFRSVKELLNNAVRHGKAKEIVIGLHWEPGIIRIVVDDDGLGFDAAALNSDARRGLGLAGIRERLSSLGGSMRLEAAAGRGTRVVLEAPLE